MISPSIIINNSRSCDRIIIRDATVYTDDMEDVESISLEVKVPGSCCFEPISIMPGWCSETITYTDLDISCYTSTTDCSPDLPDGIYEIKYTINGEEALYYHLRYCKLWILYVQRLCELFGDQCGSSPKKFRESLVKLHDVRNTILDAAILAEDCLEIDKALTLYNHAEEKLKGNDCMC